MTCLAILLKQNLFIILNKYLKALIIYKDGRRKRTLYLYMVKATNLSLRSLDLEPM